MACPPLCLCRRSYHRRPPATGHARGYAVRINELDEAESDRVLAMLFAHQLQAKYRYTHRWTEGDVMV